MRATRTRLRPRLRCERRLGVPVWRLLPPRTLMRLHRLRALLYAQVDTAAPTSGADRDRTTTNEEELK